MFENIAVKLRLMKKRDFAEEDLGEQYHDGDVEYAPEEDSFQGNKSLTDETRTLVIFDACVFTCVSCRPNTGVRR